MSWVVIYREGEIGAPQSIERPNGYKWNVITKLYGIEGAFEKLSECRQAGKVAMIWPAGKPMPEEFEPPIPEYVRASTF